MPVPASGVSSDAALKKARRQYLKSTRTRPKDIEDQWTPFRAAEKKYKARFPPPDLSGVLDLALLNDSRRDEVLKGGWKGSLDEAGVVWKEIDFGKEENACHGARRRRRRTKVYLLPEIPGLVILPSFISHEEQRSLVYWALRDHARPPNETNLDVHYILPQEGLWNAFLHDSRHPDSGRIVQPRASSSTSRDPLSSVPSPPGRRELISNTPASPSTFRTLNSTVKLPYAPSPTVPPLSTPALIPKLRWANIGWFYHWGSKQYDFSKGKQEVGEIVRDLCKEAVEGVDWAEVFDNATDGGANAESWGRDGPDWHTWKDSYEPDAGIVNFYQTKDTLMGHVDRSEVCATSPLVSISLGNTAVFLIGGHTRDVEPVPILLRSGDVLIMSGPACRRAYHGVPRILENSLPEHLQHQSSSASQGPGEDEWSPYAEYMSTTRINVNVRQVFPKGFDPTVELSQIVSKDEA